jgi:putative DNA primase/helicase
MDGFDLGSAAALVGALGGRPEGEGRYRVPCPSCGRGNLQIRDGHTRLLFKCWNGCTFEQITAAFREQGTSIGGPNRGISEANPAEEAERRFRRMELARALYTRAEPAAGSIVENYLKSRAITLQIPLVLRFMQYAPHRDGHSYPAMLAPVVDVNGEQIGVHLTFLSPDGLGKHKFDDPKLCRECRGPISGGAVRLSDHNPDRELLVGEGIESVLSALQLFDDMHGATAWAALSTEGIKALALPRGVRRIAIAVDNDANNAGQDAALSAYCRWKGDSRSVRLLMPPRAGDDFNDVLMRGAP